MDYYLKLMELCIAILEFNKMVYIEGMSNEYDGDALKEAHADLEMRIREFLATHPDGRDHLVTSTGTQDTRVRIDIELEAQEIFS